MRNVKMVSHPENATVHKLLDARSHKGCIVAGSSPVLTTKKINKMEKELIEFLKYIKEVHVDSYGHLEICDSGDELDPTVERVVKEYMKLKNN